MVASDNDPIVAVHKYLIYPDETSIHSTPGESRRRAAIPLNARARSIAAGVERTDLHEERRLVRQTGT